MFQATTYPPYKQPVYVAVAPTDTHSKVIGYLLWFFLGIIGAHRFYYGKPISGIVWFFTLGLLGIGWIVDAFLIPGMDDEADHQFQPGSIDYNVAWALLWLFGIFGIHRFYQGKIFTGILYACTGGLFTIGFAYDVLTLNEQVHEQNHNSIQRVSFY